jgi:poly-gamma-glutamate synthesis protein (capsule biosynthesis protein)
MDSLVLPEDLKTTDKADGAAFQLDVLGKGQAADFESQWVYALAAPFPTITDGVTASELQPFWKNGQSNSFNNQPLLMTEATRAVFEKAWGKPATGVIKTASENDILPLAWKALPSWAIVPFESLEPRWKVLRVDGLSPLDKTFDPAVYPLTIRFGISGKADNLALIKKAGVSPVLLPTNRNPDRMTVVMMTGTTAIVRYMAQRMEEKGVLYPAEKIGSILSEADITHISNEVPFYEKCPKADPVRREMRFCSDPKYMDLLKAVGTDVVELTGNHELDWWYDPMLYTINLYNQNGIKYYGGGVNSDDARKPLLMEDHGNKIGFIGCSPAGPKIVWATPKTPGSAKCDWPYIQGQIKQMLADGYLPIFTFQHIEVDQFTPQSAQRIDFQAVSDMGAVIVSGSQSHFPQAMTFKDGKFIHYGLGNTFFDQMEDFHRPAFLDRQIIYEGKHISTELITTMLEDYAQPRLMTVEERQKFLKTVFDASVWDNN